jgi:hypothetical protein
MKPLLLCLLTLHCAAQANDVMLFAIRYTDVRDGRWDSRNKWNSNTRPSLMLRSTLMYSACAHISGMAAVVGLPRHIWTSGRSGPSHTCSVSSPVQVANCSIARTKGLASRPAANSWCALSPVSSGQARPGPNLCTGLILAPPV